MKITITAAFTVVRDLAPASFDEVELVRDSLTLMVNQDSKPTCTAQIDCRTGIVKCEEALPNTAKKNWQRDNVLSQQAIADIFEYLDEMADGDRLGLNWCIVWNTPEQGSRTASPGDEFYAQCLAILNAVGLFIQK